MSNIISRVYLERKHSVFLSEHGDDQQHSTI